MAQKRRQPEIIAGRVNADGSIAAGDGFTVTKGTAGIYTLTFAAGFRLVSITTSLGTAIGGYTMPNTYGERTVNVNVNNTSNTLTDIAWNFTAVGVQQ